MPERKIGTEALEASAKLRKSGIDCLSQASFKAARRRATEAWFDGLTTPRKIEGKGCSSCGAPGPMPVAPSTRFDGRNPPKRILLLSQSY